MPRTLLAAVCGAGLALCGAVMQSLLRNPLADPFVLGVSSGASTGAVAVVVLGVGGGAVSLSAGAFVGALLSFGLVMLLSHSLGASMDRVVLSGVAAMQLFSALTSFTVLTSADAETTKGVLFWLLGSLSGADWGQVLLCAGALALVLVVCLGHATTLDAFAFGEEAAAGLGVNVARARLILLCATALLTASWSAAPGRSASSAWSCRTSPAPHRLRARTAAAGHRADRSRPSWCGWTPSPALSSIPRRSRWAW
jgi:iron complex transport system permease protein